MDESKLNKLIQTKSDLALNQIASNPAKSLSNYFSTWIAGAVGPGLGKITPLTKASVTTGNGYSIGISSFGTGGKMLDIKTITVSCSRSVGIEVQIGNNLNNWQSVAQSILVPANQSIIIPINTLIRIGYGV